MPENFTVFMFFHYLIETPALTSKETAQPYGATFGLSGHPSAPRPGSSWDSIPATVRDHLPQLTTV